MKNENKKIVFFDHFWIKSYFISIQMINIVDKKRIEEHFFKKNELFQNNNRLNLKNFLNILKDGSSLLLN